MECYTRIYRYIKINDSAKSEISATAAQVLVLFQRAGVEIVTCVYAELMLLGFISLLLTVTQGFISHICIPEQLTHNMLPCKMKNETPSEHDVSRHGAFPPPALWNGRRLLAEDTGPRV